MRVECLMIPRLSNERKLAGHASDEVPCTISTSEKIRHSATSLEAEVATMMKYLAIVLFVVPSLAFAQLGGGTDQERAACAPDVKRYCTKTIAQGDLAVLGCLQDNRRKLSLACRKVLADHGQ
jgi:hypothetical protein